MMVEGRTRLKASDLTYIPDPHQRMVQATKFLRQLSITEAEAVRIRDEALRVCVDEHGESQASVAEALGIVNQRVSQILKRARGVYEATRPPFS